jgi:4-amino-4-deoxy-L-arabinose transferase-like glycosyltransferase
VKKTAAALSALALLALAAAVRLPSLTAGYPYMSYVDEGNLLHPVAHMVRTGRWNPDSYLYPSLPLIVIAAAARLSAPFRNGLPDRRASPGGYDLLSPEILLTGRLMTLLAALGIVALAGRLARRLAGPRAGWAAALLAALAPPLVLRGAIAIIDPWASFFVLAALLFSERLRAGRRPLWEAFAAGAMAGFAFASKYPAVLVGIVPLWLVLRSGRPWQEKIRCLLAMAAGALLAAAAAMPGLVLQPHQVLQAVQRQGELYSALTSPAPLWHQALVRAEWDLPYDHPELGAVFLVLTLAGLVFALRDRALTSTAQAWTLFAAASLALFSSYSFHPFRNLLPLVAPACILVAILWDRLRSRPAYPRGALWADAAALLLLTLCFALPLSGYVRERLHLRDSRAELADWLALRLRPNDRVLIMRELQILPTELDRLPGRIAVRPWFQVRKALHHQPPQILILGDPPATGPEALLPAERQAILQAYEIRARFGETDTPFADDIWHGNRQTVYVLEQREIE